MDFNTKRIIASSTLALTAGGAGAIITGLFGGLVMGMGFKKSAIIGGVIIGTLAFMAAYKDFTPATKTK